MPRKLFRQRLHEMSIDRLHDPQKLQTPQKYIPHENAGYLFFFFFPMGSPGALYVLYEIERRLGPLRRIDFGSMCTRLYRTWSEKIKFVLMQGFIEIMIRLVWNKYLSNDTRVFDDSHVYSQVSLIRSL